ncbi:hypothetical protein A6R68_09427, partial [Neotoma lepida]
SAVIWGTLCGLFSILLLLLSGDPPKSEVPRAAAEGPGHSGIGLRDCFKIKGHALVSGVKPQDWISLTDLILLSQYHFKRKNESKISVNTSEPDMRREIEQ